MTPPPLVTPITAAQQSLPAVLDTLWTRIAAALDGGHAWSVPTLVTVAEDGAPRARVLVLRAADRDARRLVFHTNARSDKVRDIAAEPRVSVVFFDRDDAVQARFDGIATAHHVDPEAAAAWRDVSPLGRAACGVDAEPGSPLDAPQRFDELPRTSDAEAAFANFAVIVVEFDAVDWLWHGPQDMRRARFAWNHGHWSSSWIVP